MVALELCEFVVRVAEFIVWLESLDSAGERSRRRLLNVVGRPETDLRLAAPRLGGAKLGTLFDRPSSSCSMSGQASSLTGAKTPRYGSAYTRWPRILCGLAYRAALPASALANVTLTQCSPPSARLTRARSSGVRFRRRVKAGSRSSDLYRRWVEGGSRG